MIRPSNRETVMIFFNDYGISVIFRIIAIFLKKGKHKDTLQFDLLDFSLILVIIIPNR